MAQVLRDKKSLLANPSARSSAHNMLLFMTSSNGAVCEGYIPHTCKQCVECHEGNGASNAVLLNPVKDVSYMILYMENQSCHEDRCDKEQEKRHPECIRSYFAHGHLEARWPALRVTTYHTKFPVLLCFCLMSGRLKPAEWTSTGTSTGMLACPYRYWLLTQNSSANLIHSYPAVALLGILVLWYLAGPGPVL